MQPGSAKPDDWDEDAPVKIPDPKAEKPAAWLDDAPAMIPDPSSSVPADWDADEDGEWEAPLIANPDCAKFGCGEWTAPIISNPDYKGKWFAPKVRQSAPERTRARDSTLLRSRARWRAQGTWLACGTRGSTRLSARLLGLSSWICSARHSPKPLLAFAQILAG